MPWLGFGLGAKTRWEGLDKGHGLDSNKYWVKIGEMFILQWLFH